MLQPPQTLTVNSAAQVLAAGVRAIEEGQSEIDLGQLGAVDSSAIATLLAWQRAARQRGQALRFSNAPPGLHGLAELYDVADLLRLA